jgi:hypothetical protein
MTSKEAIKRLFVLYGVSDRERYEAYCEVVKENFPDNDDDIVEAVNLLITKTGRNFLPSIGDLLNCIYKQVNSRKFDPEDWG